MSKLLNLEGRRFGKLTVLEQAEHRGGRVAWRCICDCGEEKDILSTSLTSGKTISCGCFRRATTRATGKTNRKPPYIKRLRSIYSAIQGRCYDKGNCGYKNYGGRGISVCEEWNGEHGESVFIVWALENGYEDSLTIDRKDNDKGYSPSNCKWSTMKEQQNNRRNNRIVTYGGKEYTVSQLSEKINIEYGTLLNRIDSNWDKKDWDLEPNLNNKNIRREMNE